MEQKTAPFFFASKKDVVIFYKNKYQKSDILLKIVLSSHSNCEKLKFTTKYY